MPRDSPGSVGFVDLATRLGKLIPSPETRDEARGT
jgi:hypothetical protein